MGAVQQAGGVPPDHLQPPGEDALGKALRHAVLRQVIARRLQLMQNRQRGQRVFHLMEPGQRHEPFPSLPDKAAALICL